MSDEDIKKTLKAEYIYIFAPFLLLILIKFHQNDLLAILFSADWSLASCLIMGQTQSKVIRGALSIERKIKDPGMYYYIAKRFLLIVISLAFYVLMLIAPSGLLGSLQMALFCIATFLHFSDGRVAKKIIS